MYKQEHTIPSVPHKDYLPDRLSPDITGPDPEAEYDQEEEDQGPDDEYDDYQDNLHQMD